MTNLIKGVFQLLPKRRSAKHDYWNEQDIILGNDGDPCDFKYDHGTIREVVTLYF